MAVRGVIVEYDFAVLNGAQLLFETARDFLAGLDGIAFDDVVEARYLQGKEYQKGFAEYFSVVKTKKTAAKAARDLGTAFTRALNAVAAKPLAPAFVNFVRGLSAKGVKVVISTRADVLAVANAFAPVLCENVFLHHDEALTYGCGTMNDWRRICVANHLNARSLAVTGSGCGVKSALIAGISSVAVMNDRVAYQDFSGADEIFKRLDGPAARRVLEVMRIG